MRLRKREKRGAAGWNVEIFIVVAAALFGIGLYISNNPITVSPNRQATAPPPPPVGTTGADVIVLLNRSTEAIDYSSWNLDQAWLNAVEQEIGEYQVIDADTVNRSDLDTAAWVVVPRRAAASLDANAIHALDAWTRDGGVLLLEQPEGPWSDIIGTVLSLARAQESRRITSFDGTPARGRTREMIASMPIRTLIVPYTPRDLARGRDYQVLMEIDGRPGLISRQLDEGRVFVLLFDLARALTGMQQGVPTNELTLPAVEEQPLPDRLSLTENLSAEPFMEAPDKPWADLLERNILYLMDLERPVARLWYYPGEYRGGFIPTHSEAGVGSVMEFMIDWERRTGEPSSSMVISRSLSPEDLTRMSRKGASFGLQWVDGAAPMVPWSGWGAGAFNPVRRPMTVQEQLEDLTTSLVPYEAPTYGRSIDGTWPEDYFRGFEMLEATSMLLDSSFGPAPTYVAGGDGRAGYLFGTGLPYRPIGRNGDRHDFHELPYVFADANSGYDVRLVRELISGASDHFHTVICGDWRPDTMIRHPGFDALEGWRSSYELARSQRLWVTDMHEFAEFLGVRDAAAIRSSFAERRLSVEVRIPEVERSEDGQYVDMVPSVSFPARYHGRPVQHLWVDGEPMDARQLPMTGDRTLYIVEMVPGAHRIEVYYGSSNDLDDD